MLWAIVSYSFVIYAFSAIAGSSEGTCDAMFKWNAIAAAAAASKNDVDVTYVHIYASSLTWSHIFITFCAVCSRFGLFSAVVKMKSFAVKWKSVPFHIILYEHHICVYCEECEWLSNGY